jgi:hypothetical protein
MQETNIFMFPDGNLNKIVPETSEDTVFSNMHVTGKRHSSE